MSSSETELINARLPRGPRCGSAARRLLSEHLGPEVDASALADTKLVVSELVNNAYLHGQGQIELRVFELRDRLRVEVIDGGHGQTIEINQQPTNRGGRGLKIVEALSLAWGAFEGTTHVWAEIALC